MGGASFADNAAAERELMMFESVRTESQATQKRVLRASKACAAPAPTLDGLYGPSKPYPTNRAAFRKVSAAGAPDLVREAVLMQGTVDLSSVGLPDITFEYIDPVWVWVQQAPAVGNTTNYGSKQLPIGMIQGSGCTGVALRQETRCGRRWKNVVFRIVSLTWVTFRQG